MQEKSVRSTDAVKRTWLLHAYDSHDPETKTRKLVNQITHGGYRDSHAHLNNVLAEGDRGPGPRFARDTLSQFLSLATA
jgi:hypothetical protein